MHDVPPTSLLKPEEAAAFLSISVRQLNDLRRAGKIPGIPVGHRTIRYSLQEIMDYLRGKAVDGPRKP